MNVFWKNDDVCIKMTKWWKKYFSQKSRRHCYFIFIVLQYGLNEHKNLLLTKPCHQFVVVGDRNCSFLPCLSKNRYKYFKINFTEDWLFHKFMRLNCWKRLSSLFDWFHMRLMTMCFDRLFYVFECVKREAQTFTFENRNLSLLVTLFVEMTVFVKYFKLIFEWIIFFTFLIIFLIFRNEKNPN